MVVLLWFIMQPLLKKSIAEQKKFEPLDESQKKLMAIYTSTSIIVLIYFLSIINQLNFIKNKADSLTSIESFFRIVLLSLSFWGILNFKRWGYFLLIVYWITKLASLGFILWVVLQSGSKGLGTVFLIFIFHNFFWLLYTFSILRMNIVDVFKNNTVSKPAIEKILKERNQNIFGLLQIIGFCGILFILLMMAYKIYQVNRPVSIYSDVTHMSVTGF